MLAGEHDRSAHPGRIGDDVVSGNQARPPSGRRQGREDVHHGGLACAVGPEQAEHLAATDLETDVAQGATSPNDLLIPSTTTLLSAVTSHSLLPHVT